MQNPAVTVRVAEGRLRKVGTPWRLKPRGPANRYLADVDTAADKISPGRVNVGHDEEHSLGRTRISRGAAAAELDRASRVRRGELHRPEVVADDQVDVEPPTEAFEKRFARSTSETGSCTTSRSMSIVLGSAVSAGRALLASLLFMLNSIVRGAMMSSPDPGSPPTQTLRRQGYEIGSASALLAAVGVNQIPLHPDRKSTVRYTAPFAVRPIVSENRRPATMLEFPGGTRVR